jgi:predicted DNA-binding transcriptional regulator YafY
MTMDVRGEPTRVRILFAQTVARYVERVLWHPTQRFTRTAAGLEMTMEVSGTVEVVNWVLGFGDKAIVIEPTALRATLADELLRAAAQYRS